MAIVTSDTRSSNSSDEEDNDFKSQRSGTLLKNIIKHHGPKPEKLPKDSESKSLLILLVAAPKYRIYQSEALSTVLLSYDTRH